MIKDEALFDQAKRYIPGGVNSPVRAFLGVGGDPIFFKSGSGPYLIDENNRRYIDYVGSFGPLILGHAHPAITSALHAAILQGLSFGAPTAIEVKLAKKITELMPDIEQIRMVNSGTEATMSAIRLARGYTNRNKVIKFAGCYHGHVDSLLVAAGSGLLTLGIPSSAGVPNSVVEHTLIAEFNSLASVQLLFEQYGRDIAAVIVEPVAGNMNCVPPEPGFLPGLRKLCDQYGSLLILDEVMTGFRVSLGGATALYQIKPDLITLGKIIGGGMPVGAFGGSRKIMNHIAPTGPVYQAGTLSGNPIAMTAGLKTLELIEEAGFYERLSKNTTLLTHGLKGLAKEASIPLATTAVGSMFGLFFTDAPSIVSFSDVKQCHMSRFKSFYHGMLQEGIYFAPSAFEAGFVSALHTDLEINQTLEAAKRVFKVLK